MKILDNDTQHIALVRSALVATPRPYSELDDYPKAALNPNDLANSSLIWTITTTK